jgi:hypothetical protein
MRISRIVNPDDARARLIFTFLLMGLKIARLPGRDEARQISGDWIPTNGRKGRGRQGNSRS